MEEEASVLSAASAVQAASLADMSGKGDDVQSLLEGLCPGSGGGAASASASGAAKVDIFHNSDGSLICCAACGAAKNSADPINEGMTLAWNHHGRPHETSRHSRIDLYCEIVHTKRCPELSITQYVENAQTPAGKEENDHYRAQVIEMKRRKGPAGRITAAEWGKIPAPPVKVTRDKVVEKVVEAPDELFYTPEEYVKHFGRTPEQDNQKCEWTEHLGKKQWGCWRAEDGPLRRKVRVKDQARISTEVDDSEEQLVEGQMEKSYDLQVAEVLRDSNASASTSATPRKLARAGGSPPVAPPPLTSPLKLSPGAQGGGSAAASSGPSTGAAGKRGPAGDPTTARTQTKRPRQCGGGGGGKEIPSHTRSQTLLEIDNLLVRWAALDSTIEVQRFDIDLTKVIKATEKRLAAIVLIPNLDSEHLEWQMKLDDHLQSLTTMSGLIGSFLEYTGASTKKGKKAPQGATRPVDKFKEAVEAASNIRVSIPSAMAAARRLLNMDVSRADGDMKGFLGLVAKHGDSPEKPAADFHSEQVEHYLTEILREGILLETKKASCEAVAAVDLKLKEFLGHAVAQEGFDTSLKSSLGHLLCIVQFETSGTTFLREALEAVSKSSLKGPAKIFAALGKKHIAAARASLADSSEDAAMGGKLQEVLDLQVLLEPKQVDDEFLTTSTRAAEMLLEIGRKASRAFKHNEREKLQGYMEMVMKKVSAARDELEVAFAAWLKGALPATPGNWKEELTGSKYEDMAVPVNFKQIAVTALEQLHTAFQEKYMPACVWCDENPGDLLEACQQLCTRVEGWSLLFKAIVGMTEEPLPAAADEQEEEHCNKDGEHTRNEQIAHAISMLRMVGYGSPAGQTLIDNHVCPHVSLEVQALLESHQNAFLSKLVHNLSAWPDKTGDSFFPFTHSVDHTSPEYKQLQHISGHQVPEKTTQKNNNKK